MTKKGRKEGRGQRVGEEETTMKAFSLHREKAAQTYRPRTVKQ